MAGPGRRGHVPADRDRACRPGVASVHRALADARRLGRGRHPRTPRRLGRARLQPTSACPARRRSVRSSRITRAACPEPSRRWSDCRGSGPYTARAVAATAFGVPVAPLDVNTRRVVTRVLGVPPTWPGLQEAADGLVSRSRPGRWLDAVMDLASATCTPRTPRCDLCPLEALCASRGRVVPPEAARPGVPFPATARWLRGRLLAAVTEAPTGVWVALPDRLGHHDADAIDAAARGLERDGFLDLRAGEARVRE